MRSKTFIGGVLAAGLMLMGCGGPGVEDPSSLATREDELPACNGTQYWEVWYYAEPAHAQGSVGSKVCNCNGIITSYGNTSTPWSAVEVEYSC